ncbi:MAG: DegT/DnrJ/EryC1/StrS family aminotransferase [Candidatus Zixiibacteriota bacterium]
MKRKKIPLFDLALDGATVRELNRTLASGWISTGPAVLRFENAIARRSGVRYAAAVNSATAGLIIALKAAGVRPGQEIITTPLTFIATIEAILHVGAQPMLADVDTESLTLDPESVASRISRRTAGILSVDLTGHPCDYLQLRKLCLENNLRLIADAAHAIGALYRGKPIPSWVDLAVYSFYATKNLTCGEGGMVLSRKRGYIDSVRTLSRHGLTSNAFIRKQTGGWMYDALELGYKANMSDIHAAIGLGQLHVLDREQRRRRQLVARYEANLSAWSDLIQLPTEAKGCRHGWHLFIVRVNLQRLRVTRDDIIRLMAGSGIECGLHYTPVYQFDYYRKIGLRPSDLPVTRRESARLLTLPLFPLMSFADVDRVCEALTAIVKRNGR